MKLAGRTSAVVRLALSPTLKTRDNTARVSADSHIQIWMHLEETDDENVGPNRCFGRSARLCVTG